MAGQSHGFSAIKIILVGVGVAILALSALIVRHVMADNGKNEGHAAGPPAMPPSEVSVITVKQEQTTLTTELPGRTVSYLIAEVRPQVNGIVQKRLFTEGSDVKEGEVLYQIDSAPYQAVYDNAVAALTRSKANLPAVEARAKRNEQLVSQGAISQQEYDDALSALQQAKADIQYWEAGVESARINLEYTRVKAPIAGRIGRSTVTVGALATAHQGPAFATIQQLDPVYVDAPQSSSALLRLKRSLEAGDIKTSSQDQALVRLELEDGTKYSHEGKLRFSDVTVEPGTGSIVLRMIFPNPDNTLLPGMFVRAILEEGVVDNAILIPQRGVTRDPKGNAIAMIVNESDMVEQRVLKVDRAIGDKWLVLEGLNAGDRVILEGLQKVRPGVPVTVVPDAASQPAESMPAAAQGV